MTEAQIVGWGHTAFGKSDLPDTESLMAAAVAEALLVRMPDLPQGFFGLQVALYDTDAVRAALVRVGSALAGRPPLFGPRRDRMLRQAQGWGAASRRATPLRRVRGCRGRGETRLFGRRVEKKRIVRQ